MPFLSCLSCLKSPAEEDVSSLNFAHCSLDNVPNDIFVYERTLEHLYLECNNIRDLPRPLFHCGELRTLDVSDNDLHSLPEAISSLSNLVKLNLSKNVLTEVPDTIKQLKHLVTLDLSVNPLQKIPEGCTQLLSITQLYLNDTFLEFLPANFGRLAKLRILELRENGLNTLPKSLSRLTNLQRLDLGQNDIAEVPEVVGSLTELTELWLDANRIKLIPDFIGNLVKLNHLEVSLNHIELISPEISQCKGLTNLGLSTNDIKSLPEAIGDLPNLVTLKLDDNQLNSVPDSIGRLHSVEELILSQNYLESLPPSLGLCRQLHTLNVDDNDIEFIPKEVGSCISLRILSAHGNRLTTLPAELDHITDLAVINLTGNMIQNLPVSFMKLTNISALWLSENQNKPLIQLNQDTDPETGRRVLTNFMLPQLPESMDSWAGGDNVSESGSFHASVWEEERMKKRHVKWAGEENDSNVDASVDDDEDGKSGGQLRREPTPFPKEMRAMAKRVQKLRGGSGSSSKGASGNPRSSGNNSGSRSSKKTSSQDKGSRGDFPPPPSSSDHVEIKAAKVIKPQASPALSERHLMSLAEDERAIKEQIELKQFEEFEKSLTITSGTNSGVNTNPNATGDGRDKMSRDSGLMTPSDGSLTSPDSADLNNPNSGFMDASGNLINSSAPRNGPGQSFSNDPQSVNPSNGHSSVRRPSDPLPQAPLPPVKAEVVTTELDGGSVGPIRPPPYHIAAAMSKHAGDFMGNGSGGGVSNGHGSPSKRPELKNQHERNPSHMSDTTSSVSSEVSTAPSSLQTIVRAPLFRENSNSVLMGSNSSSESLIQHIQQQRPGSSSSQSKVTSLKKMSTSSGEQQGSNQDQDVSNAHANHLRKVSEQLLANPRTRQSVTGIPLLSGSRPGSFASPKGGEGSSPLGSTRLPVLQRPGSQLSFNSGVGGGSIRASLIPTPSPVPVASIASGSNGSGSHLQTQRAVIRPTSAASSSMNISKPPASSNGLLSTIEKAAHSDEEPNSPTGLHPDHHHQQPNYENVSASSTPNAGQQSRIPGLAMSKYIPGLTGSGKLPISTPDRMSTSQYVSSPLASKASHDGSYISMEQGGGGSRIPPPMVKPGLVRPGSGSRIPMSGRPAPKSHQPYRAGDGNSTKIPKPMSFSPGVQMQAIGQPK